MDILDDENVVWNIIHELAHFVGLPEHIADQPGRLRSLSSQQGLLNAVVIVDLPLKQVVKSGQRPPVPPLPPEFRDLPVT